MDITRSAIRRPGATKALAGLGMGWNVFGIVQFSGQALSTPAILMDKGMTPAQAAIYGGLPIWMTTVFAVGVFGGLAGSILLLIGSRAATVILAISLIGYTALYTGDITEGVFAAFGASQIAVLTTVVAIAAGLFALAIHAQRQNRQH